MGKDQMRPAFPVQTFTALLFFKTVIEH